MKGSSRGLPFPGKILLRIFLEGDDYEQAAGDFEEQYHGLRRNEGLGAARRRFWGQVFKSLPHFAADEFYWRTLMVRTSMKTAWRDFRRHKTFSTINLTGLALGMACCLLITFWVRDERSYDRFHVQGARIFRVVADWSKYTWNGFEGTPPPLGPSARDKFPEVERSARFFVDGRKLFRFEEKTFYENRGILVDPDFFEIFSFPLVRGDIRTALAGPADIVVSESMAARYFGNRDPLGQTLLMDGKPVVVRGIVKSLPRRSTIRFDYALACGAFRESPLWGAFSATNYILLKPGADVAALGSKLTEMGRENGSGQVQEGARFRLQPLWKIHLDGRSYQYAVMELGDGKSVALFSVIAALVLVVACVNFVNLATARAGLRAKEIGLRKTIGAERRDIIRQFFGESALQVGLASLLGMVLVRILLPAFNHWSGKDLGGDWLRPENLGALAGILGVTLFLAGGYPALILSAFQPARVLKSGALTPARGGGLRKALVLFQFSVSIALLVTTVAAVRQFRFMRTAGLGYDKDNVFQIPIKENAAKSYAALKAGLLQNTAVRAVTIESYSFAETALHNSGNWDWEGRDPGRMIDMVYRGVDEDYFEAMGIPAVEGRLFGKDHPSDAKGGAFILNEEAVREMGIRDPVGKWFQASPKWRSPIIGVVGDVRFQTMHVRVGPNVFYVEDPSDLKDRGLLLVRTDGPRTREALDHVRHAWAEINPSSPIEIVSLQETYDRLYRGDQRMSRAFSVFAGLAVLISFLGLLGLASFMAERRTREIGIRKVLGASRAGIVVMISGELAKWVLAANLIAWPVSYFAMNRLLRAYAYRVGFSAASFLVPSAAAYVFAFVIVGILALRASGTDPAKVLKHE